MLKPRQRPETDDWKLLGNAGTNPTVNFLGTTDNQPVVVRTNNELTAVFVNSSGDFTPSVVVGNNASLTTYLTDPIARASIDGNVSGYVTLNQNNQIVTIRNSSGALGFRMTRYGGTLGAAAGILNGWLMGDIGWWTTTSNTIDSTTAARSARINVTANGNHVAGTNNAARLGLEIARSGWGASTEVMRFVGDLAGVGSLNTPVSTWDITKWTAANALPATSGTTQSTGLIARTSSLGSNATLDQGSFGADFWLQSVDKSNLATFRKLLLNPIGGYVGARTSNPLSHFDVDGSFATRNFSTAATAYTIADNDQTINLTLNGASQTVTYMSAASVPRREIRIVNPTATAKQFAGTVVGLDAALTTLIPPNSSTTIKSETNAWRIVEQSLLPSFVNKVFGSATVTPAGTTAATASDYMSINIPYAGRWKISYHVRGSNVAANGGLSMVLTDASNAVIGANETLVIYSQSAVNVQATAASFEFVTTTGPATFKVRVFSATTASSGRTTSDTTGRSWVYAERQ